MKEFKGLNINEVWDYRLSSAVPQIVRVEGGNWIVQIFDKTNKPGVIAEPLETFDTGLQVEDGDDNILSDIYHVKINVCYNWLYQTRDKYALPNIEQLKPIVKKMYAEMKTIH